MLEQTITLTLKIPSTDSHKYEVTGEYRLATPSEFWMATLAGPVCFGQTWAAVFILRCSETRLRQWVYTQIPNGGIPVKGPYTQRWIVDGPGYGDKFFCTREQRLVSADGESDNPKVYVWQATGLHWNMGFVLHWALQQWSTRESAIIAAKQYCPGHVIIEETPPA